MTAKRVGAVLLALVLLGLTACAGMPEKTEGMPSIGICFRQESNTGTAKLRQLLESALTREGFQVYTADGKNDQTKQIEQIREMLEQGCGLLIVEPVQVSDAETVTDLLRQAEVPAIFIGREPDGEVLASWDRICFVGGDTAQPGLLQGQIILDQPNRGDINEDGIVSYIVLAGPEDDADARLQADGCAKALSLAGLETKLLTLEYCDWTAESGRTLCAQALAAYGVDIEVVFCGGDAIALGAMQAISEGGWTVGQDMYLVGIGGDADALEAVLQGNLTGTVSGDIRGEAEKVLEVARLLMEDQPVESVNYVEPIKVTASGGN